MCSIETRCMKYVKVLRMLVVVLNGYFTLTGWCLSMSSEGAFRQVLVAARLDRLDQLHCGRSHSPSQRVVVPHVDMERSRM